MTSSGQSAKLFQRLVKHLQVQPIDKSTGLFRGQSVDLGWGRVFGGQICGQAVSAATQTLTPKTAASAEPSTPPSKILQSVNAVFLRPGKVDADVDYQVTTLTDGATFSFKRVTASQISAKTGEQQPICEMHVGFQTPEESAQDFQETMPFTAPPEGLQPMQEHYKAMDEKVLQPFLRKLMLRDQPLDVRPVQFLHPKDGPTSHAKAQYWLRIAGGAGQDQDESVHKQVMVYASDFHFLETALHMYGLNVFVRGVQAASLSHSMVFHRPVNFSRWHLFDFDASSVYGSRGFVIGRVFDQDGLLVASVSQNGLLRLPVLD